MSSYPASVGSRCCSPGLLHVFIYCFSASVFHVIFNIFLVWFSEHKVSNLSVVNCCYDFEGILRLLCGNTACFSVYCPFACEGFFNELLWWKYTMGLRDGLSWLSEWLTWLDKTKWPNRSFSRVRHNAFHTHSPLLTSSSVSLSCFNLAVPLLKCMGKHSCLSSPFSIVILSGTCVLRAPILFCACFKKLNY